MPALWAVRDTGISLYGGQSWWTLLATLGVCAGLVILFYRKTFHYLGLHSLAVLVTLRLAAIAILLVMLFRPILSFQKVSEEVEEVAVLLDTSQSMSIADGASGVTRLEEAGSQWLSHRERLSPQFRLHFFAFDAGLRPLESESQVPALEAKGDSTNIGRALNGVVNKLKKIGAILLFTDGLDNSGRDPVKTAAKNKVPVYVLATGSNLRENPNFKDVAIEQVEADERLTVNDEALVTAHVDAIGLGSTVVEVVLRQQDKVLATQSMTLDDMPGPQPVRLSFTPTEKGRFTYAVSIAPQAGERITVNNAQEFSATVADAKIRVLYLEGTVRAENRPLIGEFLAKDPHIEFASLIRITGQRFQFRTNWKGLQEPKGIFATEEELKRFDVFLLADIDSSHLRAQLPIIEKLVSEGKGLVMMGGTNSFGPGGYGESALDKALPVICGPRSIGQEDGPFLPQVTPEGFDHPIFHKITDFFPFGKNEPKQPGLPPLLGCTAVAGPKPGATVLATHPTRRVGKEGMPVLAVQTYGKGRSVAFTGDTTWRWYQTMKGLGRESPYLKFWGQIVRWAAKRESQAVETTAGVTAEIAKSYYKPGEDVTIYATVREAEGRGTNYAKTRAQIQLPAGGRTDLQLAHQAGPAGLYEGHFEPPGSGTYQVTVTAELEGQRLGEAKLEFQVGRPSLEFDRLALNGPLLENLAAASGGRVMHVSRTRELLESLEAGRRQSIGYEEIDLYDGRRWPAMVFLWALFISVLTAEWLVRKKWQLH